MELKKLNPSQLEAVKHHHGPLLVVAGAGTGKTQVITQRVAYLINKHNVSPKDILAVTFTEKAAGEMEARVSSALKRYILDVKITTFNAFGYEIVRRFAYELGMNPNLQLLSSTQQLVFLKDHIDSLELKYYSPITNPDGLLVDLAAYFSKLSGELVSPQEYLKYARKLASKSKEPGAKLEASRHLELAGAYKNYQQLKRQQNVIDFDDQVSLTVELLERFPNVRSKLLAEIKYVLVDEFQDTNTAQSRLIDLLAGKEQNVMVVGDDDQSIYRFRGAAVANILRFLERYPKAKRVTLTQNYRSSQQILDSAHRLIQHNNPDRLEARYQIDKQLKGQFQGKPPHVKTFLAYDEEASFIAQDIKHRLETGQRASDLAVLVRKNTQTAIVAKYLEAGGVDYHIVGQSEDLYTQPDIKIILNFLRTVTDPEAADSFYHLMTSEAYGFNPLWLRRFVAKAQRRHTHLEELLSNMADLDDDAQIVKLQKFLRQLQEFRQEMPKLSVGQLCFMFLKRTGYLHKLIQRAPNEPELDERIASLNQFFGTLREFEAIAEDNSAAGYIKALPSLLGSGERLLIEDIPELYGQKVLILTMHKAKGLEFETVYLFDLTQETLPARKQASGLELPPELRGDNLTLSGDPHLMEERRLMYVAMTRAKKDLVFSFSADHGGRRVRKPSIFIEEALGVAPQLADLKPRSTNTNQIELFNHKTQKLPAGAGLPAHLLRGETLLLTQRQIDDYLMCPAEFYLRHIISPPQPPAFALEYGNLMHNLIQYHNRRRLDGLKLTLEDLMKYLEANWPQDTFVSAGHHQRSLTQAKATLKKFWAREQKSSFYPAQIEQSFEFSLPSAQTLVRGRFDAVYQSEQVEIRDYKTGATAVNTQDKADTKAKASFQLGVYALAWQTIKGQPPDVLSLDFIDSGLIGRAAKTPRQLSTIENKIHQAAKGIRAGDFRPARSHLFCTHSQYGF